MNSFLSACGATGPLAIDIIGPGRRAAERPLFFQPFVLIGRDGGADLVLDHDLVSRRHAYLQVIDGRIFWVDLDSRSGTTGPDGPAESGWLDAGQAIRIGPYEVRVSAPAAPGFPAPGPSAGPPGTGLAVPATNPMLARWSETDDLPRVALEFVSRTAGSSLWRMSQVLAVVGSSPRCKVRLLDSGVSKRHCALLRTSQGLYAIDLLGRGGITANGVQVRFARLGPGDSLGLGQVTVRPNFGLDVSASGEWSAVPANFSPFVSAPSLPAPSLPASSLPSRRSSHWGRHEPAGHELSRVGPDAFDPPPIPPPPPAPAAGLGDPALLMLLNHFSLMQQQMMDQFQQSTMMMMQMFGGMHREQMGLIREELDRLNELNEEVARIKAEMSARPAGSPAPAPAPTPAPAPAPPPPATGFARPGAAMPPHLPPPERRPESAAHKNTPSPEIHDWITQRLATINQEQQSRWQKVMGMLRGGQSL